MRSSLWCFSLAFLAWALLAWSTGAAAEGEPSPDKTLSPYFVVRSGDSSVEQLPLKSTRADVHISGVIADVKVTQVFRNEGSKPIEAVYVFPASTRAAVNGLTMTIGWRVITAVIKERGEARVEYDSARAAGQTASLLEQDRPNVFTMSVANIMPGDEIKVELAYTEALVTSEGKYEFVYPTVVGPRYSNQPAVSAGAHDRFIASPYLRSGEEPPYDFAIDLHVEAGLPIQEIGSSSHKIRVAHEGLGSASISLDPSDEKKGNKDFILTYRLAGDAVRSGLLLHEGKDENFFLLMVQPPKRVAPKDIPPREYIFIVDVSGSMAGFPIELSKKLMRNLLVNLRPEDRFNVLLFASASAVLSEHSLSATPEEIEKAVNFLDNHNAGGGTELLSALERAYQLPRKEGVSRTVVVVTDGYIGMEKKAFELIGGNLNTTNVFAFGIGTSVNRYLIEGMARAGQGEPFIVTREEDAARESERFREYISQPVLTGLTTDFGEFDVYDVTPKSFPDVFAERPVLIFGKWRGPLSGRIKVAGLAGSGRHEEVIDVAAHRPARGNSALRYLWARHEIARLDDYNVFGQDPDLKSQVTQLGLKYNLLTAYTSFVAVDRIVRRDTAGQLVTVEQALPLPEGVENSAVGFELEIPGRVVRATGASILSGLKSGYFLLVVLAIVLIIAMVYNFVRRAA